MSARQIQQALNEMFAPIPVVEAEAKTAQEGGAENGVNPNATQTLRRRTKVIINPPLKEAQVDSLSADNSKKNSDPSDAVSDPFKVLKKKKSSIGLKDLAYKLINARSNTDPD